MMRTFSGLWPTDPTRDLCAAARRSVPRRPATSIILQTLFPHNVTGSGFSAAAIALILAGSLVAAPQSGGDAARTQTESLSRRVAERMRVLQAEADRLASQSRTLLGDLRKLEIERDLQQTRAQQAAADATAAEASLAQTSARLTALEQERIEQLPDVSSRLVELYKQGRGGYARLLLSVRDLRDLGRAMRAVSSLISMNQARVAEHQRIIQALQTERRTLEEKTATLKRLRVDAQHARDAADHAVAARTQLITEIDSRRDLNAQLVGELGVAQHQLETAVATLRSGRQVAPVAVPLRAFRGALEWPVIGRVKSRFGQTSGRAPGAVTDGIEIEVPEGTPVHAVHGGTVAFADTFSGYGTLVIVDHGNNQFSLYGYLASTSVPPDRRVEAGEELGRAGLAPAGGAGLYLELRVDGRSVDPLQWLKSR
jgi:septal ring factor EnvC (AmiA/AmiB activator)